MENGVSNSMTTSTMDLIDASSAAISLVDQLIDLDEFELVPTDLLIDIEEINRLRSANLRLEEELKKVNLDYQALSKALQENQDALLRLNLQIHGLSEKATQYTITDLRKLAWAIINRRKLSDARDFLKGPKPDKKIQILIGTTGGQWYDLGTFSLMEKRK